MLSVVVATHESERTLVPTLSALVPGAMSGLVTEVVVADAGSKDATAEVADIAGCRFMIVEGAIGPRLKEAALTTRTPWLMFMRAGLVPEPGWMAAAESFMQMAAYSETSPRAAVFRTANDQASPGLKELFAVLCAMLGGGDRSGQGLLISRSLYDAIGGHPAGGDAEAAILRKIGRRRTALLGASARMVA
ncbi:MAG: glycosyl transferase [Proteobacteria bacterium]|nr:glycosyl transferase [Pseudomonadota bacterium]